jgi:hypothetical protein
MPHHRSVQEYGGSIYAMSTTGVQVYDSGSTFTGSTAQWSGGAIFAYCVTGYDTFRAFVVSQGSNFVNCAAHSTSYGGGAIFGHTITLTASYFTGSSAQNGGGVYAIEGLTIDSSTFADCAAVDSGGAVYHAAEIGTDVTSAKSDGNGYVSNSKFVDCVADGKAGGITSFGVFVVETSTFTRCAGGSDLFDRGGAIYSLDVLSVDSSVFTDCTAWRGGALYGVSAVTMTNTEVERCSSLAITVESPSSIAESTFTGGSGTLIYLDGQNTVASAAFILDRVNFVDNDAQYYAHGDRGDSGTEIVVRNSPTFGNGGSEGEEMWGGTIASCAYIAEHSDLAGVCSQDYCTDKRVVNRVHFGWDDNDWDDDWKYEKYDAGIECYCSVNGVLVDPVEGSCSR